MFFGDDEKYARVRENARAGKPAIAILLNRRTMIKTYEEALRQGRIEFTVVRGRGFFQRQEIVELGNLLDFLVNPASDRSLVAFLRSPEGNVSDEGIFLLSRTAGGQTAAGPENPTLWEKLSSLPAEHPGLAPEDRDALRRAAAHLAGWLELSGWMPLAEFLRLVLEEGGYYASPSRGARRNQAVSNVEKFLDSARQIMLQEGGDLAAFAGWLSSRID